jgi:hypothetical protein
VTLEHLWCGRHVKVIDGSTVSMPDTVENQKAYPQPSSQRSGCGFPIAKIGVLFSLATGAAVALAIDVVFLLAYNRLRTLMWEAGTSYGVSPLRLSLQGTRHHLENFIPQFFASSESKRHTIYRTLLKIIVHKSVPDRPGRSEPRGK